MSVGTDDVCGEEDSPVGAFVEAFEVSGGMYVLFFTVTFTFPIRLFFFFFFTVYFSFTVITAFPAFLARISPFFDTVATFFLLLE